MSKINKDENVKTYSFTAEERQLLQDIEIAMISFQQALHGMQTNKQITLMNAYKRIGIDTEAPSGYTRSIKYNPMKNQIIVTDTKEEGKIVIATK